MWEEKKTGWVAENMQTVTYSVIIFTYTEKKGFCVVAKVYSLMHALKCPCHLNSLMELLVIWKTLSETFFISYINDVFYFIKVFPRKQIHHLVIWNCIICMTTLVYCQLKSIFVLYCPLALIIHYLLSSNLYFYTITGTTPQLVEVSFPKVLAAK